MNSKVFTSQDFTAEEGVAFNELLEELKEIDTALNAITAESVDPFLFGCNSAKTEYKKFEEPISIILEYFFKFAPEFADKNGKHMASIQKCLDTCNRENNHAFVFRFVNYRVTMDSVNKLLENYRAAEKGEDVAPVAPVVASVPPADQVSLVAPTPPAVPTSDVRKGVNTSAIVVGTLLVLGGIAAAVASIFTLGTPLLIAGCVGAGVGAISTGAGIYAKVNEVPRAPIMHVAQQASVSATKDGAGKTQERVQSKSAVDLINSDKDVDGPKL